MSTRTERDGERFALETIEVAKHFGGVHAVDGLSIAIPRGKITCVVGPNGSGKSTLINLLSGMLPLDGGAGRRRRSAPRGMVKPHETPGLGITRTFQDVRSVRPDQRLGQHHGGADGAGASCLRSSNGPEVEPARADGGDTAERWHVGEAALPGDGPFLRPAEAAGDRPGDGPDVNTYLFDEPFAGLFPQMLERVKGIVRQLRNEGRTILFISHNMDIVRELSDHLIVMDSGKLLTEGDAEEVLAQPEVIEAYLGV